MTVRVTAVPSLGHTPSHTAYRISDGSESVLVWGDTVHVPEIQTRNPDVTLDFDSDPDASAIMRRRLLEMATVDWLLIAGMHVHFPRLRPCRATRGRLPSRTGGVVAGPLVGCFSFLQIVSPSLTSRYERLPAHQPSALTSGIAQSRRAGA